MVSSSKKSSPKTQKSFNRNSLISCRSEDKCYCSMVEEEPNGIDSLNTHSDTTWCDTDSCISASKCYCKHAIRNDKEKGNRHQTKSNSSRKANNNKLALDYELFTINGNGKPVQPHEALSVKKSVEAAAIFADVKLSQTTDIKSLCPPAGNGNLKSLNNNNNNKSKSSNGSCRSAMSSKKSANSFRKRESISIDRKNNERNNMLSLSSSSSHKSCSADDLLSKLSAIEKAVEQAASFKNMSLNNKSIVAALNANGKDAVNYQSMRMVSASLEDTLGYLP